MRTALKTRKLPLRERNPEQTRAAILEAAMQEFAQEGVAGARTERIAASAGVNKALLYYYFEDKERLYGSVLDHVFSTVSTKLHEALDGPGSPRECVLRYAAAHFDLLAGHPYLPRVVLHEMTRSGRDPSPHIRRIAERFSRPVAARLQQVLQRGMESGEFRAVDSLNFAFSMAALVVFYFGATPMLRAVSGMDPLTPARLAARKAAVLDFISHALFTSGPAQPVRRAPATRNRRRSSV